MVTLRENPMKEIDGSPVIAIEDYQTATKKDLIAGSVTPLDIPKSNVLIYYLENGSKVAARPSGTEPKIKFYLSVQESLTSVKEYDSISAILDQRINGIKNALGV